VIYDHCAGGKRVDSSDARESRFPADKIDIVKERIRKTFRFQQATTLVCSAACGADLLALEAGDELEMRRLRLFLLAGFFPALLRGIPA
jgi:hypothetical protein